MKQFSFFPKVAEIELSHICNLRCPNCAILDDVNASKHQFSADKILDILDQLKTCGLTHYGLTGGEPFMHIEGVLKILKNSPLQLLKINSNGFIFTTPDTAQRIITKLKDSGFGTKTQYGRSWLYISIGQQTLEGIPITNVVYAAQAIHQLCNPKTIGFGLNVFSPDDQYSYHVISKFKRTYKKLTGLTFDAKRNLIKLIPASGKICSTAIKMGYTSHDEISIADLIEYYTVTDPVSLNCSSKDLQQQTHYLAPRVLIRASGDVYACPGFAYVHHLGNIYRQDFATMLTSANQNSAITTAFTGGLPNLLKLALKHDSQVGSRLISTSNGPCDICRILTKTILTNSAPTFSSSKVF
jgi:hypothetical protein